MALPDDDPRLIQREVILLVVLALIASGTFVFTRELARRERATSLADAAEWFASGERQLREGRAEAAVGSLRKATSRHRDNRRYVLTLARALAANGQQDEARAVLLRLRELVPDDPDVSIELARLAAGRQDVIEAQRFYQNALYGIWAPGREDERLRLRVELIELLLRHEDRGRALSEVVALSTNLPDAAPARTEAGQLFLAAGDPARGLDQFTRALRIAPGDNDALAGAAEAAFALGDYAGVRRYLSRAASVPERLAVLGTVAQRVLDQDPLAPRLTLAARRARLQAAVSRTIARVDQCLAARPTAAGTLDPLRTELDQMTPSIQVAVLRDQPELVDHGLDLVYRAQRAAADACGGPKDPDDRALLLIGERHMGAS
ncbi:MAG: tetratricopeptide repeat protein [Vicinamibacterales bacterium]